jgi:acyl-CoA hydrolase
MTDAAPLGLVPGDRTFTEMTQLLLPGHTNALGDAFGGQIAAWVDICGAVSAQRFCRGSVVTASMDQLHFLRPVRRGMVVVLQARVNQAWRTSMEVGVRVDAEDPNTGARSHCCSAYLTFVKLGEAGRPVPIPTLDVGADPIARRRQAEAELRRASRLSLREVLRAHQAALEAAEAAEAAERGAPTD